MPWLRVGDTAGTHPRVLRLAALGDDRLMNEAFGFVIRCATQSAAHLTDYVIDEGVALLFGGARSADLLDAACRAGLLEPIRKTRTNGPMWRIAIDPEFLHIRLKAEVEWERQRKRDAANPALTVPVRLRDGDGCRYCGNVVQWTARRGDRRGGYDHRIPSQAATVDTYVVCCAKCNRERSDDSKADDRIPLLPTPAQPYYSATSLEFLARNGITITTQRPGTQPDTAPATPTGRRDLQKSASPVSSAIVGPGRDGSGRVGSGATSAPRRRRGKRGGKR